jgi:hypothetical protein
MVVVEQPSEGAPSMGKSITDLSSVTTGADRTGLIRFFKKSRYGSFGSYDYCSCVVSRQNIS